VTGNVTRSILCLPIKDATGKTIAVLQAVNKVLGRTMATHAAERPHRDPRGWIGRSMPLVPLSPTPASLTHAPSLFRSNAIDASHILPGGQSALLDDYGSPLMDTRADSPEVFIQTETFERHHRHGSAPGSAPISNDATNGIDANDDHSYVVGAFTDQDEELMGAFCIEVGGKLI
jgi:hypothetical protein